MGPITAMRLYFTRWLNFSARARRFEFFWYILFHFSVMILVTWLFSATGNDPMTLGLGELNAAGQVIAGLTAIYWLFSIVATLSLMVRRVHDMGQTGWLVLGVHGLLLVPVLGALAFAGFWLWLSIGGGTTGTNAYGSDPRFQPDFAFD